MAAELPSNHADFKVVDILPELRFYRLIPNINSLTTSILYDVPVVECTREDAKSYIKANPKEIIISKYESSLPVFKLRNTEDITITYKLYKDSLDVVQFLVTKRRSDTFYAAFVDDIKENLHYNKEKNRIKLGTGDKIYGYPDGMLTYLDSIHKKYSVICGIIVPEGSINPIATRKDNNSCSVMGGRYRKRGTMHRKKSKKHRSRRQRK